MTQLSRRALLRRAGLAAGLAAGGGLTGVLLQAAGPPRAVAGAWLRSQPFRSGEGGYSCYRTPGLVITAAGTVLAFCGGRVDDCATRATSMCCCGAPRMAGAAGGRCR